MLASAMGGKNWRPSFGTTKDVPHLPCEDSWLLTDNVIPMKSVPNSKTEKQRLDNFNDGLDRA